MGDFAYLYLYNLGLSILGFTILRLTISNVRWQLASLNDGDTRLFKLSADNSFVLHSPLTFRMFD